MSEEYTLIIKLKERENEEQEKVRCFYYNPEACSKEQFHIIGETENSKFELYLCGFHFTLASFCFYTSVLEKARRSNEV